MYLRTFSAFGDEIRVVSDSSTTGGSSATIISATPPGGGPPPHLHANEDETFTVLDGDFELLREGKWLPAPIGQVFFAPRNHIHTFRNIGSTLGHLAVFIAPGGFERFLEEVAPLSPPRDLPTIIEIATKFGISFHFEAAGVQELLAGPASEPSA